MNSVVDYIKSIGAIIVPIITSVISYYAAVKKSKNEIATLKEQHRIELEKIEKQTKADIKKLEKSIEAQVKLYEVNAQTDVAKEAMSKILNSPDVLNLLIKDIAREYRRNRKSKR